MTQTESQDGRTRRVLVHSDGGSLPQPESDDEDDVDELPPSYDRDWGSVASNSTSSPTSSIPSNINTNLNANSTSAFNPSPLRQEAFPRPNGEVETQNTPEQVETEREREIRERIERERQEQDAENVDMWLAN